MEVVNRQVGKKDRKNITHYCHNLPPNRIGHNIRVETYCHLLVSQKEPKMVEKGQKSLMWQKTHPKIPDFVKFEKEYDLIL